MRDLIGVSRIISCGEIPSILIPNLAGNNPTSGALPRGSRQRKWPTTRRRLACGEKTRKREDYSWNRLSARAGGLLEEFRANVHPEDNPDLYVELWQDSENPSELRPAFLRTRHRGLSEQ